MFSVDLNFEWNEEAMIFHEFLLIFLFRLKGYLDWQHFRKRHSESYLITTMFKVPSQNVRDTLATVF